MSVLQKSGATAPPLPASSSSAAGGNHAVEASVRQLIANGKFKTALESAKQFHKARQTAASESLLLDAYRARIQSLLDQNLTLEAKSLLDLVRERFPSAKAQLEGLVLAAAARGGDMAALLQPLNDPALSPERRAAIELSVQTQVTDLAALANCTALSPEHSLRQAAAALERAFNAVTSGPVTGEQIALPEVSHRSPLAPWKLLIRAIACFHRGEDEACRECLAAIRPDSVPARLVPAMQAMLGSKPASALKPAEAALVSRTGASLSELRAALANLDRAFAEDVSEAPVFKAVRAAIQECQRSAPEQLTYLKQLITVRGGVARLDAKRLVASLEGAAVPNATFFRMFARTLEIAGDPTDAEEASKMWDRFRQEAVREGWFRDNGTEAAVLYLHMADSLGQLPDELLRDAQRSAGWGGKPAAGEDRYFLFPEKLYARACAIDPHTEAFAQWMRWERRQSVPSAERLAREWSRILPGDIQPLLYLMEQAEKRNAFPTALAYLAKAERIDAVHSTVRTARLKLLAAAAMRHLQKKKPRLAAEKIAEMAALPQSRQGDRPAFLAAMRLLIAVDARDEAAVDEAAPEVKKLMESPMATEFLVFGLAATCKRAALARIPSVGELSEPLRAAIPAAMARVMALAKDLGIMKFGLPVDYFGETEAQFPRVAGSLDVEQLRLLGALGMATNHPKLTWAAAGEGLQRGGPDEAQFMLLRARAMPPGDGDRFAALAAAAAALGRFHRDMGVVDQAVEMTRNSFDDKPISFTVEQAREVVRKELASPAFPDGSGSGPDYGELLPTELCDCPKCRRERGETNDFDGDGGELDEAEMERMFNARAPKGMPPELAKMMFEVMKNAFLAGESPEAILDQILGEGGGGRRKKSRRRRR